MKHNGRERAQVAERAVRQRAQLVLVQREKVHRAQVGKAARLDAAQLVVMQVAVRISSALFCELN